MINFLQVPPVEPQPGFMQQYSFIIMIGLMVLVLWLFMWRPEAKRRKQMQAFRDGLKKGDKVITAGGIYGTVKEIKETTLLIEVDGKRNAAHRQEHGGSRQQRPPASVNRIRENRKSCKFCSFFVCRLGIYPYICTSNRSNPGTIPITLSRGGESFKRLLQITPFSAMFF
ncbi:MAG: preprotein translocase subunit YajC [Alistipes finegoldii]